MLGSSVIRLQRFGLVSVLGDRNRDRAGGGGEGAAVVGGGGDGEREARIGGRGRGAEEPGEGTEGRSRGGADHSKKKSVPRFSVREHDTKITVARVRCPRL